MNQTTPTDDLRTGPADNLDRLLSEFFRAQMRRPWPPAPSVPLSEPSTLSAARPVAVPNQPVARRDSGGRARYTLAASIALLLGACWLMSNGFQPGARPGPGVTSGPKPAGLVDKATASDPPALKELRNDKTKQGNNGVFTPPPVKFMP